MDEYIKREDAIRNVAGVTARYAEDSAMKSLCLNALLTTPTADVVPKSEVERLQAEKDALIKNYAECMKDYAREIFAEVNMQIIPYSTDIYIKGEELIIIPKSDYNAILTELKKKYPEGEDKPAATEEKYFSPEDVRKMTNQEVREKYTAIRRSMERW